MSYKVVSKLRLTDLKAHLKDCKNLPAKACRPKDCSESERSKGQGFYTCAYSMK